MRTLENASMKIIEKARGDMEVCAVLAFGSYARGEAYSDIDLCLVLFPKPYSALALSQKRLEYLKEAGERIDVQLYQQLPLYIRQRVLKEGRVLLCKDEDALYEIAFQTIREFEDFKDFYYEYLESVAHAR